MALFYPLTQGVPPELMSIFKLKSASGAHFQHTWTHFMQNSRKNLTFYSINIIYYLFTKFCTTALFAPTTSITAELSGIKGFSQPKKRSKLKKNVVSPLKIIIFEKVIIYEIAASSWYRWYLSC